MSNLSGMCHVCGIKLGTHTCRNCGRLTCDIDFDSRSGLCSACRRGRMLGVK